MDFFYKHKRIGSLKEKVFRRRVQKSKHLFRMYDAWGIQFDALQKLRDEDCEELRFLETEDNKIYSVSLDKLYKLGRVEDFGEGMQVFLPRSEWTISCKH